jgi:Hint module
MKEIQVGDRVLTASSQYVPVYAFAHLETTKKAEFLQIYTSKFSKTPLEVSASHMVFLEGKRNPVRADSIRVGDVLATTEAGATVEKISTVTRNGLYAPLTADGTLVVDGIKASNYISLQDNAAEYVQLQHGFTALSQHDGIHLSFAPYRMICMKGLAHKFCHSYGETGMPGFVAGGVTLAHWVDSLDLNIVLQFVLLVAYITLYMAPFVLLEYAMNLIWSYGALALLVGAAVVTASKVADVKLSAKKMKAV